MLGSSV